VKEERHHALNEGSKRSGEQGLMSDSILPKGTVTFLFTDIEGSTKLWENYPLQMQDALRRHDEGLRAIVKDYGGCVFKMVGDACCAAFLYPREALRAAVAAQRFLFTQRWPEPIELRVRAALHSGTAEVRDEDYFGPSLNRVARLLGVGYGGQVLLSSATHNLVCDHPSLVDRGARLLDLGEHLLKDLNHPEHIYQLAVPDLPDKFPALRTSKVTQDDELVAELVPTPHETEAILEVIQQMKEGRGVTGLEAEEFSGGRVKVAQNIERSDNVTGARIGRIGPP
jgi:class 3 adenylate cyclase